MPGKMVIFRGLPGSGKTTTARELQATKGGTIVGRDHIRAMLFGMDGADYSYGQEKRVSEVQDFLIRDGLRRGDTVYVDDMNLRDRYVRRLMQIADSEGAELEVMDMTNVDIDLCHLRNIKRDKVVPDHVIEDNYAKFIANRPYPLPLPELPQQRDFSSSLYVPDPSLPPAIIVDIDGTLAHTNGRDIYDLSKVYDDLVDPVVYEIVSTAETINGYTPIFMSGREDKARKDTERWLWDKAGLQPGPLFMRPTGDKRKDYEVKLELFDKHVRHSYHVLYALDDRKQVVDAWRSIGIKTLQVAPGDF